jgi:hypothetical protein
VAGELRYLSDYATKLYVGHPEVQQVVADVYGDILDICCYVRRLFLTKRGDRRRESLFGPLHVHEPTPRLIATAAAILRAVNPLRHGVQTIMENFERHNNTLKKATLHADRALSKSGRDAQAKSSDRTAEEFRCVRAEVRKQCHAVSLRIDSFFFF